MQHRYPGGIPRFVSRGAAGLILAAFAMSVSSVDASAGETAVPDSAVTQPQAWMQTDGIALLRADGTARAGLEYLATPNGQRSSLVAWSTIGAALPERIDLQAHLANATQGIPVGQRQWVICLPYDPPAGATRRVALRSSQDFKQDLSSGKQTFGPTTWSEAPCAERLMLLGPGQQEITLGSGAGDHLMPVATPDGAYVAALVYRNRRWQIARFTVADASEILFCPIPDAGKNVIPVQHIAISDDGGTVWFASTSGGRLALHAADVREGATMRRILAQTGAHCFAPASAPSGAQIAFSRRTHRDARTWQPGDEAWLAAADGTDAKRLLTPASGESVTSLAWIDDTRLAVLLVAIRKLPTQRSPVAISMEMTNASYRLVHLDTATTAILSDVKLDMKRLSPP